MSAGALLTRPEFVKLAVAELAEHDGLYSKIQIDNLPNINAEFGSDMGDRVINEVRKLLLEFEYHHAVGVVSPSIYACLTLSTTVAKDYLGKLEDALARINKETHWPVRIEFSVGLATVSAADNEDIEKVILKTNKALSVSTRSGKATVYHDEIAVRYEVRKLLSKLSMTDTVPAGFSWVLQPVVELSTLEVGGYESLVRWNVPDFGLVSPEIFIPVAEELGVVQIIDYWALKQSAVAATELGLLVGINASAVTLESDENFVNEIVEMVESGQYGTGGLVLELTETAVIENVQEVAKTCIRLREVGVQIAIDDFGRGETNLNVLSHLPVDYLKMDKGLLRLATTQAVESMMKIGLEMASMLNARVVCEGIETQEDLELCQRLGVHFGQGWRLGMPQALEDLDVPTNE